VYVIQSTFQVLDVLDVQSSIDEMCCIWHHVNS
jgi:hypothetical protein